MAEVRSEMAPLHGQEAMQQLRKERPSGNGMQRRLGVAEPVSDATPLDQILMAGEVFDSFPYGIMVLDREGRMLACNQTLKELVGLPPAPNEELSCCELFGCRQTFGSLPNGCLTELELQDGGRLSALLVSL